jgi:hypothetical protein
MLKKKKLKVKFYKFWKTQPIDISKNTLENKSIENIDISKCSNLFPCKKIIYL